MKKKLLAAVCAAAMALSAYAIPTYATTGDGCVDFENGEYEAFAWMKTVDADADFSELSLVDFDGSKQLAVKVVDATKTAKLYFEGTRIWAPADLAKIKKITVDVTIVSQDGTTAPGWNGTLIGTSGVGTSPEYDVAWSQSEVKGPEEYSIAVSPTMTLERRLLLPTNMFNENLAEAQIIFIRYSNTVPAIIYYDNLTAYDADGNIIAATFPAAASDGATTSAATGNTPAIVMATVMALAGGTALISRRRKLRK
ncbi:MAG: hypothetical protein LBM41_02885 [Ruminococcus sp.]|nr:hypothetical protein [Ruminococcus sp.]